MRQNKHFELDIEQNFLRPGELSPCLRRGFRGGSDLQMRTESARYALQSMTSNLIIEKH